MKTLSAVALALTATFLISVRSHANEHPVVIETLSKLKVDAFSGSFSVPENRANPGVRTLTLRYVRLPALAAEHGPPVVYLAGGPGASGIDAITYRYPMFAAMRKYGDVIALDQRGTGASNDLPTCTSREVLPTDRVTSDARFRTTLRNAFHECLDFWVSRKVDLAAYNTIQNAQDLDALRKHLGAEKIVLWGTSYGAHLALAALKEMEGGISKVVLSSVRGLDQNVKLPNTVEPYLDRLQQAAGTAYPDIRGLMQRVHRKLDHKPVRVKVKRRDGTVIDYLLQRRDMQLLAVSLMSDPGSMARALDVYLALDRGEDPGIDRISARFLPDYLASPGEPISLECMPIVTNVASGVSASRRAAAYSQSKTAVFGPYLDWILPYDGIGRRLDNGTTFRVSPSTDVPVLVFSGTLDGRTVLEEQLEAVRGLRNAVRITVENAGHNLFDAPSNDLLDIVDRFMTGQAIDERVIRIELPASYPKRSAEARYGEEVGLNPDDFAKKYEAPNEIT